MLHMALGFWIIFFIPIILAWAPSRCSTSVQTPSLFSNATEQNRMY